jgi:hypothetical protein
MKGDDMDQMEYCEHPSWSLELDDSVDPAEADGVPVCDFCHERLDLNPADKQDNGVCTTHNERWNTGGPCPKCNLDGKVP